MATVERPRTTPLTPTPETTGVPSTAAPVFKPPKPFFLRSWFAIVLVVGLIAAHVYGWQKAQIQPELLVTKSGDMQRLFAQLLQPEILLHDQKQMQISLPMVGVETEQSANPAVVETGVDPVIRKGTGSDVTVEQTTGETMNVKMDVSTDRVVPGQTITVSGTGMRPNTEGQILWQSTGTNAFTQPIGPFKADGSGNFTTQVTVPSDADRVLNSFGFPNTMAATQTWDHGDAYFSPTVGTVMDKVIETIFLALMGTSFAIIVSIPLSFLAARNLMPYTIIGTGVYTIARTILNILRAIEPLILAIIFAATVGLGPFAGVLALTVHSIASLGKLYSEAIESIDTGPIEAITATGATRLQMIVYAVVPQVIPQFLSFTIYRWDINVRMSTIIGFVGGGGIGFILAQFINLGDYHKAATALWAIAIVVIAMDWASAKLRARVI